MQIIEGLRKIIGQYDTYLVDIYGVLYDGIDLYSGAVSAIEGLKGANKRVLLFSNMPRPGKIPRQRLEKLGLNLEGVEVVTSGDFLLSEMQNITPKLFQGFGGKAFILGWEKNEDLFAEFSPRNTKVLGEADYLILLLYIDPEDPNMDYYCEMLAKGAELGLPAICPNPDISSPNNGKMDRHPSGYFAQIYKDLGGEVYYFGKPYQGFYDFALSDIDRLDKVLAIGDLLYTDIRGANDYGIDSLWVKGGVHRDERDPVSLCKDYKVMPNFIIDLLKF